MDFYAELALKPLTFGTKPIPDAKWMLFRDIRHFCIKTKSNYWR